MKAVKAILNTLVNILIVVVLVVSILIAIFALTSKSSGISTIFGYTLQTIQTDSMKGGSDIYEGGDFEKGDVIIGKATNSDMNRVYQVGDIVTYMGQLSGTEEVGLICHRIIESVELEGDVSRYCYRTAGDNSPDPDQKDGDVSYYIVPSDIKSVFYDAEYHGVVIKGLGNVLDFIQSQLGFFLVVLLPMIIFFLYELIRVIFNAASYRNEKQREAEKGNEEEQKKAQQEAIDAAVEAALKKREEELRAEMSKQDSPDQAPPKPEEPQSEEPKSEEPKSEE